jgi:hypothetical protein
VVATDIEAAGGFAKAAVLDALDERAVDEHAQDVVSQAKAQKCVPQLPRQETKVTHTGADEMQNRTKELAMRKSGTGGPGVVRHGVVSFAYRPEGR